MNNLGIARKRAGYTQKQAAALLELPLSSLRRWEQGANESNVKTILKMANPYEVSTDFILGNNSTKGNDCGVLLTPSEIELLTA